jgi:hypothetical protein
MRQVWSPAARPGIVGMSDLVQFARLAKSSRANGTYSRCGPGYRRAEALPKTRDLLLDLNAAGLRAEPGDQLFVLAGLSAGGRGEFAEPVRRWRHRGITRVRAQPPLERSDFGL